jgi:uncharacterized membrane-anchored protein YitT (DUF2179 family)
MEALTYASLIVNIAVLLPIVILMGIRAKVVDGAWGPSTPARGILFSIYFSILVASVFLLLFPVPSMVAALLAVQVIYKVTTPFTVGIKNPVVISNLAIAALHIVTIWFIWTSPTSSCLGAF